MTVSIGGTVDISNAEIDYGREARYGALSVPNKYGDTIQPFKSKGYTVSVKGVWVVGTGGSDSDWRDTCFSYEKDNTPVTLNFSVGDPEHGKDIDGRTFFVTKFNAKLVAGIPTTILINYNMELLELT